MLTIEAVSDLKMASPDGNLIAMTVKFSEFPKPIHFVAFSEDISDHGKKLFAEAKSGVYGAVAEFVPPPEGVSYGPQPEPA